MRANNVSHLQTGPGHFISLCARFVNVGAASTRGLQDSTMGIAGGLVPRFG
jgi:hypothetical protein